MFFKTCTVKTWNIIYVFYSDSFTQNEQFGADIVGNRRLHHDKIKTVHLEAFSWKVKAVGNAVSWSK